MRTQKRSKNRDTPHLYRKWIWSILLCLLLAGCSAPSALTGTPQPQPRSQATPTDSPFHGTLQTFDRAFTVTLDITPNHSGINVFTASVLDNHTAQPASGVEVTLYTTMQDMAMGTNSLLLHASATGQFSATGNNLSMDGHWAIGIVIQTPDHILHKAGVNLVTSF